VWSRQREKLDKAPSITIDLTKESAYFSSPAFLLSLLHGSARPRAVAAAADRRRHSLKGLVVVGTSDDVVGVGGHHRQWQRSSPLVLVLAHVDFFWIASSFFRSTQWSSSQDHHAESPIWEARHGGRAVSLVLSFDVKKKKAFPPA
jgi:hypothetical protein